jgi:lysophospholipase L1-like esterase
MPGYRQAGPQVIRRYAGAAVALNAAIEPIPFRREKPEDSFRIVVQGGSTAAGFPYGRWGGLAGMLGDRLEATFPEREIEVITTAMAGVNSNTLVDLVDEIIDIEPDAVLVYAGHNEYLGVLGVGSALTAASAQETGLQLWLRRLGLYQIIELGMASLRSMLSADERANRISLFERAAAGALIPFGSPAYQRGIEQLDRNLSWLLRRYADAGIPVYLGTLVSNEHDQAPFVGGPGPQVDLRKWQATWSRFERHMREGEPEDASTALRQLIDLDPGAATPWFALGQLEEQGGRLAQARDAYLRARDRDQLRFRAPGAFNDRIRELAQRYGATLVDVEARFTDAAPTGIPGRELLLEHVHPNAEGYFLLADAFYDALARDARIGAWPLDAKESFARRDMPLTAIDRIQAAWDVQQLSSGFPFRDPPTPFELPDPRSDTEVLARRLRLGEIDWLHAMEGLLQLHQREGRLEAAAVVARIVAQAYPLDAAPNLASGLLQLQLGQPRRARRYLERSLQAAPNDVRARAALAETLRWLETESTEGP